jgi:pimeloyl-ACP methyl ester carboxylesterase
MLPLLFAACGAPEAVEEVWDGDVEIPGAPLHFTATLAPAGEAWAGVIDIPLQGAEGLALTEITSDGQTVSFTLQPPGAPALAKAVFSGQRSGDTVTGTLQQVGQEFPLTMRRLGEGEAPVGLSRPQTPRPPFPYRVEEVSYTSGDITIAGTLTAPDAVGPHPAALLITGSGAQDRDETIFEHKPFAVIADRLTREGVAVLRVDDRGVGGTGGSTPLATRELLVGDVQAGVAFLRGRDDIDPVRVGLVGHSEGGMLGPMAAAEDPEIAFVVMLAGPGISSKETLVSQGRVAYEAAGAGGEQLASLLALHGAAVDAAADPDTSDAALEAAVRALVEAQLALAEVPMSDEALQAGLAQLSSPWLRSFAGINPPDYLSRVGCPTLALIGGLDFQVQPALNLPALREALAHNERAVVEELPGLNHLFQTAETGLLNEYAAIEETFAPAALDRVAAWVTEQVGVSREGVTR